MVGIIDRIYRMDRMRMKIIDRIYKMDRISKENELG
jgi:hypothetical protein